jgi:hypothetical protein
MKTSYSAVDPLRTFEMDEEEWDDVVTSVKDEGREAWGKWAPAIVAAIEEGYLDDHLQMLATWMRERYLFLKNTDALPPMYSAGIGKPMARAVVANPILEQLAGSGKYDMMPVEGIRPVRNLADGSMSTQEFTAKGWVFRKSAFIGKHFIADIIVPGGALFRIDKVNRLNFQVTVVAATREDQRGRVGRQHDFLIEKQFRWYNIPRD